MSHKYGYFGQCGFALLDPFDFGYMLAMCSHYGLTLPNDEAHNLIWDGHDNQGDAFTIPVDLQMTFCTLHDETTTAHFAISNGYNHLGTCDITTVVEPTRVTVTIHDDTGWHSCTWAPDLITATESA